MTGRQTGRRSHRVRGLVALRPFTAMTTSVQALIDPAMSAARCRRRLRHVFAAMESRLTRFRPDSELNRAQAAGGGFLSPPLFRALTTAARARRRTGGLFDPRVRGHLEALGYDARLRFGGGPPAAGAAAQPTCGGRLHSPWVRGRRAPPPPDPSGALLQVDWSRGACGGLWTREHRLRLVGGSLDLGGIGKGLALRYAARNLRRLQPRRAVFRRRRSLGPCGIGRRWEIGFLVNAGGDIWAEGGGPDRSGWTVGVPDPRRPEVPLVVLRVSHRAVCTSSVLRRAWTVDGLPAHHLIDPRTGRPAETDHAQVTVIGRDPAWAEVWSKSLLVAGADAHAVAERGGLAAILVTADGRWRATPAAERYLCAAPPGTGAPGPGGA